MAMEPVITLPDGYKMELVHEPCQVLHLLAKVFPGRACHADYSAKSVALQQDTEHPPLLFVHGSFHAAWCWQVRLL